MSTKGSSPLERQPEGPSLQGDRKRLGDDGRAPGQQRARFLAGALTVTVHLAVFAALLWPRNSAPPSHPGPPPPPPIQVSLLDQPKPTPPGPPEVTMVKPDASYSAAPALPRFSTRTPVVAATTVADDYSDVLSDSELAGAATVGEGGGGGGICDMARVVQQALRRDPLVRAAVEDCPPSGQSHHAMEWRLGAVGRPGRKGPVGRARGNHVGGGFRTGSLPQQAGAWTGAAVAGGRGNTLRHWLGRLALVGSAGCRERQSSR